MSDPLVQLAERMFVGPVWPASILVLLLIGYTILGLIGLIDFGFDLPDVALGTPEIEVDSPGAGVSGGPSVDTDFLHGVGATTVRWTNFGRVPIVLWGGLFAVAFWSVSYGLWHGFDSNRYEPSWLPSLLLTIRNIVLATALTKLATQPLLRYFVDPPSYDHRHLLGATCEICTAEANSQSGQAKFRTNAAPLLLNVRTDGPHIPKGTEVRIIGFDQEKRIYTVTHLQSETPS